jgi:hypothetical protein
VRQLHRAAVKLEHFLSLSFFSYGIIAVTEAMSQANASQHMKLREMVAIKAMQLGVMMCPACCS